MTVPTISTLPPAPQRTQTPEAFATTADTFVASLPTLVSETNTTIGAINNALAGALVTFNAYQGDWSAGTYASGDVVLYTDGLFYISLADSNTQEPPDTNWKALLAPANSVFAKDTPRAVAWTKTGAGTAETATGITLEVNGAFVRLASGTSITMPTLTAGTDYAIWCAPDGTLEADASFTVAPTANGRLIGGFHYAPGGNAAAQAGGNTTAQINEYSFWDLKFRPSCDDPRGMTLVSDHFWSDIYLLNTDPDTNGTSANDKTIANGNADYPIIPDVFGRRRDHDLRVVYVV